MTVSYGDAFDAVGHAASPDSPAVICDDVVTPWSAFDARSNALARVLRGAGLADQAKVALYMRNGADYLIAFVACFKARLVPVNINYRYGRDEIAYLLENSDAEAIIVDAEFAPVLPPRKDMPAVRLLVSTGAALAGAETLASIYAGDDTPLRIERSPNDIFLLYTGGTTGLPKGVMWPSGTLWNVLAASRAPVPGAPPPMTVAALANQISDLAQQGVEAPRYYIAPPFMHGTGLFSAISVLSRGGAVVCSARPSFDPPATLGAISRHRCSGLIIVGDAFGRPLLDALRASPGHFDVSGVTSVVSSGMMWSPDVKQGLLEFMPDATLADGLGATEAASIAVSLTTRDAPPTEARFVPADAIVVHPDTLEPVAPGSPEIGLIAKAGDLPLGYYKDPERTARTYVVIDGARRLISGDHATVAADGTIHLLGRGSLCINTAGEKVFPEEVEQALKSHPLVSDALVFAMPDPRLGQMVAAVATLAGPVEEGALVAHVKDCLAGYKAPKRIVLVASVPRAPNGKADYPAARALFEQAM